MTTSILTNAGALVALRTLEQTTRGLQDTQNRISTGLKVQNAKDNASFWAVSTVMRSDVNAFKSIGDNLSLASNSTSVARDGAQNITKLIDEIKSKTTSAQEGSIDKKKLQADIDASLAQIGEIVKTAQFNGVNLLSDDKSVKLLSSIARNGTDATASFIEFSAQNLSLETGGGLESLAGISVLDRGDGVLKNKTDGATKYDLNLGGAIDGTTDGSGAAGTIVKVKYDDAKGVERTVDVKLTEAVNNMEELTKVLKSNKQLGEVFDFSEGTVANHMTVSAKDRDVGVTFKSLEMQTAAGGAGLVAAAATAPTAVDNSVDFNFQDAPLRNGEEFSVKFNVDNVDYDLTFRVANGDRNSGDILQATENADGSSKKLVLAIDAREVTGKYTSGKDIANQFKSAMDKLVGSASNADVVSDFIGVLGDGNGVAVADEMDYGVTDNKLSFHTLGGNGDKIVSTKVPETDYQSLLDTIEGAMQVAVDAATTFGSAQKRVDVQKDFVKSLVDNLTVGIGTLVDANMQEESARLQALQVQQQLGVQALSMANQAPQTLLSLFR